MNNRMALAELLPEEGILALQDALYGEYQSEQEFHNALVETLAKYKDTLKEKGVDHEYLAYAIEAQLAKAQIKETSYTPGMRVRVHDGSGEKLLGDGTYEGNVKVYFVSMPDGSLQSLKDAEQEPPPEMVPEGAEVICSEDNPKIRLDSGEVVYGCQVWWSEI